MVVGRPSIPALLVLVAGCGASRKAEDPDWYSAGEPYDVLEPIAFTEDPYGLPAGAAFGFGDLQMPPQYTTWFEPDDVPPAGCGDWAEDGSGDLPVEITGVVTVHPRVYIKVGGCVPEFDTSIDSEEKYYGSFFIEDDSGGIFVLGDSKVAHFEMGDRVTLRVRGLKNHFEQNMVAVHDVVSIERGPFPIHYDRATAEFDATDLALVRRVTGTVVSDTSTFGELTLEGDSGQLWNVGLDQELTRRGVNYPMGTRIEVTGPVLRGFQDSFPLIVMKKGQVAVLDG